MTFKDFDRQFKEQSFKASINQKIMLAIAVSKKLFTDYKEFSIDNNFGNSDLLIDAINLAENYKQADSQVSKNILPLIEAQCPHSDDFGSASYAINASGSIYETLEFLIDNDSTHIYNIGTYLINTIDSKIQDFEDLTEEEIDNHPLMIEVRTYLLDSTK